MGVDFSHGQAHFGYTSFRFFREKLATLIGVDRTQMQGCGGERPWTEVDDPLTPLLNRSDGDGRLTAEETRQVAARFRELMDNKRLRYQLRSEPWEEVLAGLEEAAANGDEFTWG